MNRKLDNNLNDIELRKEQHLITCLEKDVSFIDKSTGFDQIDFIHNCLPELDKDEINTSITLFGKKLSAPIIIGPMTGGTELGMRINRNLAKAAQELKIGMGVGSQRILFEHPNMINSFRLRNIAPDIFLMANLGAVQLNYSISTDDCESIVKLIDANALSLHLNPLQEAVQPNGNINFKGLLKKIGEVIEVCDFPLIIKECGCGISCTVAAKLHSIGVHALDISGAGGTSWAKVEGYISQDSRIKRIAHTFSEWGIPTVQSLIQIRESFPDIIIFASGGIASGLDIAKAIALGADAVVISRPLLKSALRSFDDVCFLIGNFLEELKTAMFCVGVRSIYQLKNNQEIIVE